MFSTGQIIFACIFAVGFVVILFFAYRKDKRLHLKNYKGVKWIALIFFLFIVLLFILKYFLKN